MGCQFFAQFCVWKIADSAQVQAFRFGGRPQPITLGSTPPFESVNPGLINTGTLQYMIKPKKPIANCLIYQQLYTT